MLLGLFLVTNSKGHHFGMQWLGIFFICLALNFADGILFLNGFYLNHPSLAFWEDPFVFMYGPLLLFFARGMRQEKLTSRDALHLLPFAIVFLTIVFTYHLKNPEYKREILDRVSTLELPTEMLWVLLCVFLHFFIYALSARKLLIRYRENLRGHYSHLEVKWSLQIVDGLLLIFIFSLGATLIEAAGNLDLYKSALVLSASFTAILVFRILMRALSEPLFKIPPPVNESKLNSAEESAVIEKVNQALQNKIFEDPTLTINQLSERISEPSRLVSQVINKHMANNFYDLINRARIDEAGRLLKEAPEMNISEIMYASGFNSKSSFNTQFRKTYNCSPSAFRKNLAK